MRLQLSTRGARCKLLAALALLALPARAVVLPEDRTDTMYHYYDGGGTKVDGPALLVRKSIGDSLSAYAGYYVDNISGASIDVVTTASPYKEKRIETNAGIDYIYRDALFGFTYTRSTEPDYKAGTTSVKYSQETFGGMTTVTLGYALGKDTVLSVTDPNFSDRVDRYQWRLGVSQILTKSWLLNLDYEAVTEEGFLNSPYRAARVLQTPVAEAYPRSRSSHALALTSIWYLQPRSSVRIGYRTYFDNWDINAGTVEGVYSRYFGERWVFDFRLRGYSQTRASFYADDFPIQERFMARDKELSTFKSHSIGFKGSYKLFDRRYGLDRANVSLLYDYTQFKYQDFTDIRTGELYSFNANVVQMLLSVWY